MKSTLEELLARINILDVVSQYVKLRKAGKDYMGLCPFHKEKTPSFTVSIEKQIYYCFGCREGGNAINFVMKYENLSFKEALESLAKEYGVEVRGGGDPRRASHFDALARLSEYYFDCLKGSRATLQYLNRRGIDEETIREFRIGYSDPAGSRLKSFLKSSGVPNDVYLSTGIVRMKDRDLYDMFRGRVVIPIFDVNKKVIGFGGRTLEKDGMPKYINSPESSVFSKRTALFGIDKTRKDIAEQNEVFIVEGYFDFISLYRHGFRNVVATLGTSVTEQQVSKLRNYTSNVSLMLDGDEAGIKSALRLIGMFAEMDLNGAMVLLPEGHDPDSFVRKEGVEAVRSVVKTKKPILDYYFDYNMKKEGIKTLEGKQSLIKAVMPYIEMINDGVKKRLYIKRLSELTGVEETYFKGYDQERGTGTVPDGIDPVNIIGKKVVSVFIHNPDLLEFFKGKEVIEYVRDEDVKEILTKMLDSYAETKQLEMKSFIEVLEKDTLKEFVLSAAFDKAEYDAEELKTVLSDYFKHLKKQFIRDESKKITELLSEAEKRGDEGAVMKLLEKKRQVLTVIKNNFL
ncbi:MAG TPA: DNA primase [Syntrophorhabdaceae bacterium]|nr:DNA primase [Syntrophorhabdaceae bacterium]HQM80471.1 DNA primase [Syntrophorhabdaceae bacterium]